ncbi:MAG: type II toxin-antitoxin system HicB family antitoxin [Clostridia bacterium]|jgi:predicted RNase H-like HicB family nuclease|nr:type II toxin-antitoxin system HicB family antitoxin [Clostridia bacterium]
MKTYIYPAILYLDEESKGYTIAFHDLQLFTEGDTVEESYERAREYLEIYSDCVLKYGGTMPDATKYLETAKKYKDNIVLLVDSKKSD